MKMVPKLTLDDARIAMEGAERKAREIGVDMDIAVTDDGGYLLMFRETRGIERSELLQKLDGRLDLKQLKGNSRFCATWRMSAARRPATGILIKPS